MGDLLSQKTKLLIWNVGNWDLLHIHDIKDFEEKFEELLFQLKQWYAKQSNPPILFFITMGTFETDKMQQESKKEYLTTESAIKYNKIMEKILKNNKNEIPVEIVNINEFMEKEIEPTNDGVHPNQEITERVLHKILDRSINLTRAASAPKQPTERVPGFSWRNSNYGFLVGCYLFLALMTGDIFLVTNFILKLHTQKDE